MKNFYSILKFYINSSIHVAVAVVAFAGITFLDFGLEFKNHLLVFIFFSTLVAYTFVKHLHLLRYRRSIYKDDLKYILVLASISIVPILVSLFYFKLETLVFIVLLGIFTLLYVLPFLPKAKNLREVNGLKIFIIALVWTGTTVILPFISSEIELSSPDAEKILYIMSRFFIVIALIIPFEIRDLKLDQIYLKTLPQVLGVFKSKVLAINLVLLSMLLLYCSEINTEADVFIHVTIIGLIWFSRPHKAFYYTALLVESVPVFWFLSKLFFN